MKVVINRKFGSFSVSKEIAKELNLIDEWTLNRADKRLIEAVIKDPKRASGEFARLAVVEIPDEATDWEITEYDGAEGITYVMGGKLYHI